MSRHVQSARCVLPHAQAAQGLFRGVPGLLLFPTPAQEQSTYGAHALGGLGLATSCIRSLAAWTPNATLTLAHLAAPKQLNCEKTNR